MIKEIIINNFMGKTKKIEVGKVTKLYGKNRVGKTTVREAICFVFAGTDSLGNKKPIHLISRDADRAQVTLVTDKAKIVRSLTQKKGGTLSLERVVNGQVMKDKLTQTQMESFVGPADLFLSCFIPGYFLSSSLKPNTRLDILSFILPKVDKISLLEGILKFKLTDKEKEDLADLASGVKNPGYFVSLLSENRRSHQRQIAFKQGELKSLESKEEVKKPVLGEYGKKHEHFKFIIHSWGNYNQADRNYRHLLGQAHREEANFLSQCTTLRDMQEQLKSLTPPQTLETNPRHDLDKIRSMLKPMPPRFRQVELEESPRCSACGQFISEKHRETTEADNLKRQKEWEKECEDVVRYNDAIEAQLSAAKKENDAIDKQVSNHQKEVADYERLKGMILSRISGIVSKKSLTMEMALNLTDADIPRIPIPVPQMPVEPSEPLPDEKEVEAAKREFEAYNNAMAVYEHSQKSSTSDDDKFKKLSFEIANLEMEAERIGLVENALKQLPQVALEAQFSYLSMKDYKLEVDSDVKMFSKDGMPVSLMSYGERMKAENALSVKLGSLYPKAGSLLFMDNAESNDDRDITALAEGNKQVFAAYMDPSVEELKVEVLS